MSLFWAQRCSIPALPLEDPQRQATVRNQVAMGILVSAYISVTEVGLLMICILSLCPLTPGVGTLVLEEASQIEGL